MNFYVNCEWYVEFIVGYGPKTIFNHKYHLTLTFAKRWYWLLNVAVNNTFAIYVTATLNFWPQI